MAPACLPGNCSLAVTVADVDLPIADLSGRASRRAVSAPVRCSTPLVLQAGKTAAKRRTGSHNRTRGSPGNPSNQCPAA